MSVVDRDVIDIIGIDNAEYIKKVVLYISDHVNWDLETIGGHLLILQDKINDYPDFIRSDQISEHYSKEQYQSIKIMILFSYPLPSDALIFLNQAKGIIQEAGYELDWKYDPEHHN